MLQSKVRGPTLINIDAYIEGDPKVIPDAIPPDTAKKLMEKFTKVYEGKPVADNILAFDKDKDDWYLKIVDGEDFQIYIWMMSPKDDDYISENWVTDIDAYMGQMNQIKEMMPKNRIANLRIIATSGFDSKEDADVFLNEYSAVFQKRINEIGWIYGNTILTKDDQVENSKDYLKDYVIAPVGLELEAAQHAAQEIIDDLGFLAVYEGKLERMYRAYVDIEHGYKKMEQKSVKDLKATSGIFHEEMSIEDLETRLITLAQQFSEISTMTATLSHDKSTVVGNIYNARTIYDKWNEKDYGTYPMVHAVSLRDLETISYAYDSIFDKLNQVRARLQDNLDIIKTYLDLKQQKYSINLQKGMESSGRTQLDMLETAEEEKKASEATQKSLDLFAFIIGGLGIAEVLSGFGLFLYESRYGGDLTPILILLFILTFGIPIVLMGALLWMVQNRSKKRK
jgi:hypothetical protein